MQYCIDQTLEFSEPVIIGLNDRKQIKEVVQPTRAKPVGPPCPNSPIPRHGESTRLNPANRPLLSPVPVYDIERMDPSYHDDGAHIVVLGHPGRRVFVRRCA
jgi:hypothetical protein